MQLGDVVEEESEGDEEVMELARKLGRGGKVGS
jgi:hypothetical protein